MAYCGTLFSKICQDLIRPKQDTKKFIQETFTDKESIKEFVDELQSYKLKEKDNQLYIRQLQSFLNQKIEQELVPEDLVNFEEKFVDDIEPSFIQSEFIFTSKTDALKKLFKGKESLLLKYEQYISKYLLNQLYLNPNLATQITSDEQLISTLCKVINKFSNIIINKDLLSIDPKGITYDNSVWYLLNSKVNELLSNGNSLDQIKNLIYGKATVEQAKVIQAISYANFNTILGDYLPGIININSNYPGFDIRNINSSSIFSVNSQTQGKGFVDEEKVLDRNSNLGKLLLTSFDNILAIDTPQGLKLTFSPTPVFNLANYYYVASILSSYVNTENYTNELNQLLTAMIAYKATGINHLSLLEELDKSDIGNFNRDFFTNATDLTALLKEPTHLSTIVTMYYNMQLKTNDPVFSKRSFGLDEKAIEKKFSLTKYHQKYSLQENYQKQNIHSLIYSVFQGTSPRQNHDIVFDAEKQIVMSSALSSVFINRESFNMLKAHRNLRGMNDEIRNNFIRNLTTDSITFVQGDISHTFKQINGYWQNTRNQNETINNQIYELFRLLTNIDVKADPFLYNSEQFSLDKIIQVEYAMIKLYDSKADELINKRSALKDTWDTYSAGKYKISTLLSQMGQQYGKLRGIFSKMTILSRDGKQLPTYGNVGVLYNYNNHLRTLRSKKHNILNNNLFIQNPTLFKGTSTKNQIVKNGAITDFRSQSSKDQIITNIFYEWLQRRRFPEKSSNDQTDSAINNDGTVHFQPVVYSDKTPQNVIKVNTNEIIYTNSNNNNIERIDPFEIKNFTEEGLQSIKSAAFHTLRQQHKERYNLIRKSYINLFNHLSPEVNSFDIMGIDLQTLFTNCINILGDKDLQTEWRKANPTEPLIKNLYFEKKNGKYVLNSEALFNFNLFDIDGGNSKTYRRYQNFAIIQFLTGLSHMNIVQDSRDLALFKTPGQYKEIIDDLNTINDPKNILILNKLNDTILNLVKSNDNSILFNDEQNALHEEIQKFLENNAKIYQQYFWENELFSKNYELSVNGPWYLHPQKGSLDSIYADSLLRLSASQKRNVSHLATVIPYGKNQINGHAAIRKIVVIKEPTRNLFNPQGEQHLQDVHDGGEHILLLQRILENNSMQGFSNPIHHKSIISGRTMTTDGELREALLFKYASYQIGNNRLRKSTNYQNLVKFALSQDIPFQNKINFVTDYNQNRIDYGKFNLFIEINGSYKKLLGLQHVEGNNYKVTFEYQNKEMVEDNVIINNLYDLYSQVLGQHKTVDVQYGKIISNNNKSWEVLQNICNSIGFRLNNLSEAERNTIIQQYSQLSGNAVSDIEQGLSNTIDNQLNVVQPLKFAYISNFIPESCIKFGGTYAIEVNYFNTELGDLPITNVYDMTSGVQQDTEHEGEDQTEPTQMINGISLDNLTPEKLTLYKHIANYVLENMLETWPNKTFFTSQETMNDDKIFMGHVRQLQYIYKKLQSQVLNSAYDKGQTAQLILNSVQFAENFIKLDNDTKQYSDTDPIKVKLTKELYEKEFRVPLSHISVFKNFVTTLASLNTKIGIRRMAQGAQTVLSPHDGYLKFIAIPSLEEKVHKEENFYNNRNYIASENSKYVFNYINYTTLTPNEFVELCERKPVYKQLLNDSKRYRVVYDKNLDLIQEVDFGMYKHYEITDKNNDTYKVYIESYDHLQKLKKELLFGDIISVRKDMLSGFDSTYEDDIKSKTKGYTASAGRNLKPIDFDIVFTNERGQSLIYNLYDAYQTELLFALNTKTQDEKIVKTLLKNKNYKFLNHIDIDTLDTRQLNNVLRKVLSREYEDAKVKGFNLEDDPIQELYNGIFTQAHFKDVTRYDAEIIMSHPQAYKFGANNRTHLLDITLDYIKGEINKQFAEVKDVELKTLNETKYNIPQYFLSENGNIYVVEQNKVKDRLLPLTEEFIFTDENGDRFVTIDNKQLLRLVPEVENKLRIVETKSGPKLIVLYSNLDTTSDWGDIEANISKTVGRKPIFIQTNLEKDNFGIAISFDDILLRYLDAVDANEFFEGTDDESNNSYYKSLNALQKAKYSQFQMMLKYASTRIPGQSYQSFSSTRVTNFLFDEANTILVNAHNVWLTGGDYDIDKLYHKGYNLSDNGRFAGWNPLFNDNTYDHLLASLDLPGVEEKINKNPSGINLNDIIPEINLSGLDLLNITLRSDKSGKLRLHTQIKLSNFKQLVKLYNSLIRNGYTIQENDDIFETKIENYINFFNTLEIKTDRNKALQNRITLSTRQNLGDISNAVASYSPISIHDASLLKADSPKEVLSRLTHPNNPLKQVEDIYNQYAGKNVVGIMAAGLKLYATVSYTIEKNLYQTKSADNLKHMLFSQNIYKKIDDDGNIVGLTVANGFAGIDYTLTQDSINLLKDQLFSIESEYTELSNEALRQKIENDLTEQLSKTYSEDSVQLAISGLLSAATDNGKEMILGIINSGKETQGTYLYSLMLGYSLPEIGEIMTSEPVNFILNNIKRSILSNDPYKNILDVTNYFINGVSLSHFLPNGSGSKRNLLIALCMDEQDLHNIFEDDWKQFLDTNKDTLRQIPQEFISEFEDVSVDLSEDNIKYYDGYVALYNYYTQMEKVNTILSNPKNKIYQNIFAKLLFNSQLYAQSTQVLSQNQRVKSNEHDLIRFYIAFEDTIRNYLPTTEEGNVIPETSSNNFNHNINLSNDEVSIIKNFDFHKFMTDENYSGKMIEIFDKVRQDLNPLALFKDAEHFKEMINVVLQTDQILQKNSIVYRTLKDFQTNKLRDMSIKRTAPQVIAQEKSAEINIQDKSIIDRSLSEKQFNIAKSVVDDLFVHNTLILLQQYLISRDKLPIIKINNNLVPADLTSQESRKDFVNFIETVLIPGLKFGKIDEDTTESLSSKLKNNKFLKELNIRDFRIANKPNQFFEGYSIENFKASDTLMSKFKSDELTIALYDLKDVYYQNTSVIDLLFLYNIILHRGKDGEFTLSSFFDPDKVPGSLVNQYYAQANRVNEDNDLLPLTSVDLQQNGFDKTLDFKLDLNEVNSSLLGYKYIAVGSELSTQNYNNLIDELKNFLTKHFEDLNIKFNCE